MSGTLNETSEIGYVKDTGASIASCDDETSSIAPMAPEIDPS